MRQKGKESLKEREEEKESKDWKRERKMKGNIYEREKRKGKIEREREREKEMKYLNRERRRKGKIFKNLEKERKNWKREEKDKKRDGGEGKEIFKRERRDVKIKILIDMKQWRWDEIQEKISQWNSEFHVYFCVFIL